MSRVLKNRSKYTPHQGPRERARRLRQIRAYWLGLPGCKLSPSNMGRNWGWVLGIYWENTGDQWGCVSDNS
jgi:hypothetical protein